MLGGRSPPTGDLSGLHRGPRLLARAAERSDYGWQRRFSWLPL